MNWYAAHAILYFRKKDDPAQEDFLVWENVYLVQAATPAEALELARRRGREVEQHDPTLTVDDEPAEIDFGGIRKLITCSPPTESTAVEPEVIENGMEATYNEFTVTGRQALDALIRGEAVTLRYEK